MDNLKLYLTTEAFEANEGIKHIAYGEYGDYPLEKNADGTYRDLCGTVLEDGCLYAPGYARDPSLFRQKAVETNETVVLSYTQNGSTYQITTHVVNDLNGNLIGYKNTGTTEIFMDVDPSVTYTSDSLLVEHKNESVVYDESSVYESVLDGEVMSSAVPGVCYDDEAGAVYYNTPNRKTITVTYLTKLDNERIALTLIETWGNTPSTSLTTYDYTSSIRDLYCYVKSMTIDGVYYDQFHLACAWTFPTKGLHTVIYEFRDYVTEVPYKFIHGYWSYIPAVNAVVSEGFETWSDSYGLAFSMTGITIPSTMTTFYASTHSFVRTGVVNNSELDLGIDYDDIWNNMLFTNETSGVGWNYYSVTTFDDFTNREVVLPDGLTWVSLPNSQDDYLVGSDPFGVVFPSTCQVFNNYFQYLPNLTKITCLSTTAPTLTNQSVDYGLGTLRNVNGTIYYPAGSDYSSWLTLLGNNWTAVEI